MSAKQPADVGFTSAATVEQRLIESLCPPEVAVAAAHEGSGLPELFPEEQAAVATALESRRLEFSRGRICARRALRRLGVTETPIPVLPDRAPQWPAGIVGSITHSSGLACAAVAWKHAVAGIGIDVETREKPMRETLDRFIRTPAERARQRDLPSEVDPLRLVFSAKESVHKCVAPFCGITLGFHEVELDVDVAHGTFRARLVAARNRVLPDFRLLLGRFAVTPRYVMTTAVIRVGCGDRATIQSASLVQV